jgi:transmembrane 9 superfamily protein 1
VNKVGPYYNPHETYSYYTLPVCRPDKVEFRSLTLGEVLDGDRMSVALYDIGFKEDFAYKKLCSVQLSGEDLKKMTEAVEDLYYFEFVFDDLPVRGFIGHLEEGSFLPHKHEVGIWNHLLFTIQYNGDKIISANVSSKGFKPFDITNQMAPLEITYSYAAKWVETKIPYTDREKLLETFFPKELEIHWLSVVNSIILVVLLIGFVVLILTRILKNDFARYNYTSVEESDNFEQDDFGWKIIHGDVFRFPSAKSLLSSILGVGSQFLSLSFIILVMAMLGMFNVHRHHAMNSAAILLYAFTSGVAGFVSGKFYSQIGGTNWVWNIVLTASLFAVPFFLVWSTVNSVAWAHHSTQALPFTTVVLIMFIWLVIGFPLTIFGGILGKNMGGAFDAPCRTKNIAREIPQVPFYKSAVMHMLTGGFLPFSAISVELYYIFSTLWGRETYTLYGILMIVFLMLIIVTACTSITLTYFQLSAEDYRWWWRSVISAGSTGFFVFGYGVFYFYKRSHMYGLLQTVEYFGYIFLVCYVFFITMGTVSFFSSLKFVRYIYQNIKMD